MRFVSFENLVYYNQKLNERLNNLFTEGLHSCKSCGAPYKGNPVCEYCGRNFFVNMPLFCEKVNE